MLKTAHDAEEFMRTGARVSPSWPGGDLRGRIRCSRLISRRSRQNPLQTGRPIRFQQIDVDRRWTSRSLPSMVATQRQDPPYSDSTAVGTPSALAEAVTKMSARRSAVFRQSGVS